MAPSRHHRQSRSLLLALFAGAGSCWAILCFSGQHTTQARAAPVVDEASANIQQPAIPPAPVPRVTAPAPAPAPAPAAKLASPAAPATHVDRKTFFSLPPDEQRRLDHERFAAYFDKLDALRTAQRTDRAWQREIETDVSQVMETTPELQGAKISGVECGSTLCRVTAEHDADPIAQDNFQHHFLRGLKLTASVQYLDGKSIVYLARNEDALPSFD